MIIDLHNNHNVYILGAGFSHDAGLPLISDFLIRMQLANGSWNGQGHGEEPIVATCFSLLFLSKGLAPVLINKLEYESEGENQNSLPWNRHPQDIRNLTELITGLPGWP